MANLTIKMPDFCAENCPFLQIETTTAVFTNSGKLSRAAQIFKCKNEQLCIMWADKIDNKLAEPREGR